jgi:hypothetical protein
VVRRRLVLGPGVLKVPVAPEWRPWTILLVGQPAARVGRIGGGSIPAPVTDLDVAVAIVLRIQRAIDGLYRRVDADLGPGPADQLVLIVDAGARCRVLLDRDFKRLPIRSHTSAVRSARQPELIEEHVGAPRIVCAHFCSIPASYSGEPVTGEEVLGSSSVVGDEPVR